jgi:hypothetical protein
VELNRIIPNHKEHDVDSGEVEVFKEPHIDNGSFLKPFPDHQGGEAEDRDHDEGRYEWGAEPVVLLPLIERDLQRGDPDGQQGEAEKVELTAVLPQAR